MNSKQVEQLKRNLSGRDTAELLEIWGKNDRKSYVDEAFEAIRLILTERGMAIPQQPVYVPIEEKENWWMPKGIGKKTAGSTMLLIGIVMIILSLIWFWSSRNGEWNRDPRLYCYVGAVIGGLLAIIGALLFYFGKCQEIRQRNLLEAGDSQSECERKAYPRGYRKKIDGIILLAIGITGMVMGFFMVFGTMFNMPNMDTPEDIGPIFVGFPIFCVACLMAVIGATLYFVGRSQAKKQKNQNIPPA